MAGKKKKYTVLVGNLVGFDQGATVTDEELEEHGGNAAHLLKLGAISAGSTKEEQEPT